VHDDLADIHAGSSLRGPGVYMAGTNPRFPRFMKFFLTALLSFGLMIWLLLARPGVEELTVDLPGEGEVLLEGLQEYRVYEEFEVGGPGKVGITYEVRGPDGTRLPVRKPGFIEMNGGARPRTMRSLEGMLLPTESGPHRVLGREAEPRGGALRLVIRADSFGWAGPVVALLLLVFGVSITGAAITLLRHGTAGTR
jgi:hypothetical protein